MDNTTETIALEIIADTIALEIIADTIALKIIADTIALKIIAEIKQIFPDPEIYEKNFETNNKPLFYIKKKSYVTDSPCMIDEQSFYYKGIIIPKSEFQINLENKI